MRLNSHLPDLQALDSIVIFRKCFASFGLNMSKISRYLCQSDNYYLNRFLLLDVRNVRDAGITFSAEWVTILIL